MKPDLINIIDSSLFYEVLTHLNPLLLRKKTYENYILLQINIIVLLRFLVYIHYLCLI